MTAWSWCPGPSKPCPCTAGLCVLPFRSDLRTIDRQGRACTWQLWGLEVWSLLQEGTKGGQMSKNTKITWLLTQLFFFFLFFLIFIFLLFICAYNAWVISPPCPHLLPQLFFKQIFHSTDLEKHSGGGMGWKRSLKCQFSGMGLSTVIWGVNQMVSCPWRPFPQEL
jgi:hypothetical protein